MYFSVFSLQLQHFRGRFHRFSPLTLQSLERSFVSKLALIRKPCFRSCSSVGLL